MTQGPQQGCGNPGGVFPCRDVMPDDKVCWAQVASPPLMFSDNPETITDPTNVVLWQQTIVNASSTIHRVFLWHVNNIPSSPLPATPRKIALTIQNSTSNSMKISNIKASVVTQPNGTVPAACLLAKNLPNYHPPSFTLSTMGMVGEVWSHDNWFQKQFVGAQIEFQVPKGSSYKLRTVHGPAGTTNWNTTQFTNPTISPVTIFPPGSHNCDSSVVGGRGSWSFFEIAGTVNFTIPSNGLIPTKAWYINCPNKTFTSEASSDQCSCPYCTPTNPFNCAGSDQPPYGAIVHVYANITNNCTFGRIIDFGLNPRGGVLYGASKFESEPVVQVGRLPPTKPTEYLLIKTVTIPFTFGKPMRYHIQIAIGGGTSPEDAFLIKDYNPLPTPFPP